MINRTLPPHRFCMITTFYPPFSFGGDGIFVYRLSNELARRGHHVEVVHCADSYRLLAGTEPTEEVANHPNVTVHTLRSPLGFLSPLATQQTGHPLLKRKRIRQILDDGKFDVIHFHNISLVGGPAILAYGDAVKLYTLHEHWMVCPTHTLWKWNREICTSKSCLSCCLSYKRPPQLWRYGGLLRDSTRHVDTFIAPTRFTLHKHREHGLDAPIVQIPNFLSEPLARSDATPSPSVSPPEKPYFLFVGRIEKLKGLQTLIPVFRDYPWADLLVVGDGDYGDSMRRLAADLPRIKFVGRVPFDELRALFRKAIALICPSIGYETFCMVVVEALAERTPVIARDLGGLGEIVRESGGGIVYRADEELVGAMNRLRLEPGLRESLGEAGHRAYVEKWSPEPHLGSYFSLIAAIEAAKTAPSEGERTTDAADRPRTWRSSGTWG